jgi:hypothetical protein
VRGRGAQDGDHAKGVHRWRCSAGRRSGFFGDD